MEKKLCKKCNTERNIEDFDFKNKVKRIRHSYCKYCRKLYGKQHYQDNMSVYKKKAYEWTKQHRVKTADYLYDYLKTHPCVDCGETDPRKLEFDHVNGKKDHNISDMVRNHSIKKIEAEISKCDVRCANCHRVKTAEEQNWRVHQRYTKDQKNKKKT